MNSWWQVIFSSIAIPIMGVVAFSVYKFFKNRREFKIKIRTKLEMSFLLTPFTNDELTKRKINGDWINLINSFKNHFSFFQNVLISETYKNRKISKKLKIFINTTLREFLVKWERYNREEFIKIEQPIEFFDDLVKLKEKSKYFYEKNIKEKRYGRILLSKLNKIKKEINIEKRSNEMHKVFISFFNKDLNYKEALNVLNAKYSNKLFLDGSVSTNDISDNLTDEQIRKIVRDEYLRDTSVTVVLVGKYTKDRKHVDWEIGSSVIDGERNKRSGIVVVQLPIRNKNLLFAATNDFVRKEIERVRGLINWVPWDKKNVQNEYEYLPERLKKNIKDNDVDINILRWDDIVKNPLILNEAIDEAYKSKDKQSWDTSIPFRRNNNDAYKNDNDYLNQSEKVIIAG